MHDISLFIRIANFINFNSCLLVFWTVTNVGDHQKLYPLSSICNVSLTRGMWVWHALLIPNLFRDPSDHQWSVGEIFLISQNIPRVIYPRSVVIFHFPKTLYVNNFRLFKMFQLDSMANHSIHTLFHCLHFIPFINKQRFHLAYVGPHCRSHRCMTKLWRCLA